MSGHETDGEMLFNLLQSPVRDGSIARLGRWTMPKRTPALTPNYFAFTSRGSVPHMTPDVLTKHTSLGGVYMALEDFIEISPKRKDPAIFEMDHTTARPLHKYTATPSLMTTILGARRNPAVVSPLGNGPSSVSVFTSTGFQVVKTHDYCDAVELVKPDVVIPMADLTFSPNVPNSKRQLRMVERTEEWLDAFFNTLDNEEILKPAGVNVFAPLLPVEYPMQYQYIKHLAENHLEHLSGLAVYDADLLIDLEAGHGALRGLPRLSLDPPLSPHHVLRQIRQGVDFVTMPFLNSTSDGGVAMTFSFPPPAAGGVEPLGVDMWSQAHQVSLQPLMEGCECYACSKHHRAYIQHLLNSKEMLGWTLLQIHNHFVMARFFDGIRESIADGSFVDKIDAFLRKYEAELPTGTGERPRARGYHFKGEAGATKINPGTWQDYHGDENVTGIPPDTAGATGTSSSGIETPIVPEANAEALKKSGFATELA